MEFLIGGTSAMVAGFCTNPLEVVKTRMQLQGELKQRGKYVIRYKNFAQATYVIAKHDGISALQKGLVPVLLFQMSFNGCRLGGYQLLQNNGFTSDTNGTIVFHKNLLVSGFCGAASVYLVNPLLLVKTHLQAKASKEIAFGHQHNHSGTWSAFKTIHKREGVKGLYRGSGTAVVCAFVGSTSQLMSFSYVKQFMKDKEILRNNPISAALVASMIGGIVLCLAITPFDLILTRLYNQGERFAKTRQTSILNVLGVDASGGSMLYRNFTDSVMKIWYTEGFRGFYKGLGPSYVRLAPHTVLCLVFWEKFQNIYAEFQGKEEIFT